MSGIPEINWIMFLFFVFFYAVGLWKEKKELNLLAGAIALVLGIVILNDSMIFGFLLVAVGIWILGTGIGEFL